MANATIKTIAKEANVSVATVSKALNDMPDISEAVKQRIRDIAEAQGYTINSNARSLASGRTFTMGVLLPDIAHPGYSQIVNGLFARLNDAGYSIYLYSTGGVMQQEAAMALQMVQKRVGVVIAVPGTSDVRHIEEITGGRVPVIYLGGVVGPGMQNTVISDDYSGGRQAARYLYRCGHRHCRVLTQFGPNTKWHQRMRGFVEYMQTHNCTVDVREAPAGVEGADAGEFLARRMMEKNRPHTAIFATDDLIALGAMGYFKGVEKQVPADISVVGYGDLPCSSLQLLGLTSVRPPYSEMGICAADLAVDLIQQRDDMVRNMVLEPQLIKRQTVATITPATGG